jgi:TonB family protein
MRARLKFLSFILVLLTGVVNAQTSKAPEPSQWLRYTVKGEEFSVSLPAEPSMKTADIFVTRLKKSRLERVVEAKVGAMVYRVYVYENPKPRQSLDDFIAEQTANSELTLTFERDLTVGKFTGKQYSSQERAVPSTEQFFATEGRLFRFVVRGATADHAGARQFFSSVMLGKKQDGVEVLEGGPMSDAVAGMGPFLGKDVDTKVRLLSKPDPTYTDRARYNQVTGTVVLKAIFSGSGKITNIRVVQGLPDGLTERAIEAARKIKFIPATKEGKYVSMWLQLEYNFNLY